MIIEILFAAALAAPDAHASDARLQAPAVEFAQYEATPRGYRGVGNQFGRGWERDRKGTVRGTGANFGGGFEGDRKRKTFTGTGTRFGGGYDVGSGGRRVVGTGNNFGKGWELSSNGREWIGTGGNFGKTCPARRGSSFVPCM